MPETRFFKRDAFLISFAAFEDLMQTLVDDCTILIERDYPVLSCYSLNSDCCYDEDEILERVGDHLGVQLLHAFPLMDAEEIYFVASKSTPADVKETDTHVITYKDLRSSPEYQYADVVEVFSAETGEEIADDIPDETLDPMEVVDFSVRGGWGSVTLKTQGGSNQ